MKPTKLLLYIFILIYGWLISPSLAAEVTLSDEGNARMPITLGPGASDHVRQSAEKLATQLQRITGAEFTIRDADEPAGIAVGTFKDFTDVIEPGRFTDSDPARREEYILRSSSDSLMIIGATELAVQHAVWDLLYRVGYRQYFPGPHWEIVPSQPTLTIDVDLYEVPDYKSRWFGNGGGWFEYDEAPHDDWYERNRVTHGLRVPRSHVYDKIVYRRREAFEQHPEWLALIDGKRAEIQRNGNKFCISNPELRAFVVDYAIWELNRRPQNHGVSMEPSDGGGWCECEPCAEIGSVSDRAITLANQVAEAINEAFEDTKYVGILAYGEHSPPPSIDVHPNVIVTVANGFLRGGYRFEELLEFWGKHTQYMGVYEYLGVLQWSWDRPGRGRAAKYRYVTNITRRCYELGARTYVGETEANWGPAGFGYFMVSRVLWDVDEADDYQQIYDRFLGDCFGSAEPAMRTFYGMINGDKTPLLSRNLVGRMYRQIDAAYGMSSDPAVLQRLDDLVVYTRYVEMYLDLKESPEADKQAAFEKLMKFIIRTRHRMMVHTREIHRQLSRYDDALSVPEEAYYRIPYSRNAWTTDEPFERAEAQELVRQGIAANKITTFEPVEFATGNLRPAAEVVGDLPEELPFGVGTFGSGTQNYQRFFTLVEAGETLNLTCTGGLIRHYRDRGDARIKLLPGDDPNAPAVDEARVPPDGVAYPIQLTAQRSGLHQIEITDGGDRTYLQWPDGMPMTLWSGSGSRIDYRLSWILCFYVPKGTKTIGGYSAHPSGSLRDPDGNLVRDFDDDETGRGFFNVPVPEGTDGRFWWFYKVKDRKLLMTVPPAMARQPSELLLPADLKP